MVLLEPAEPFAMRAVRQYADHVVLLCPANQPKCAVKQIIGAVKVADRLRRGMNNDSCERFNFRCPAVGRSGDTMNLHVPAPDIKKLWRPRFHAIGALREIAPNGAPPSGTHRTL